MWNVGDIVCWGCVMFRMWDVGDVGCLGSGMFGMWDVGCWGCGMFVMWVVRDVGCEMFAGMWDVDLQNAYYLKCKNKAGLGSYIVKNAKKSYN